RLFFGFRGIRGRFFSFCSQTFCLGFGGFSGLACLLGVRAAFHFVGGILTRFRFAGFGGGFVRGGLGLRHFFGFLFYGDDASFFCGLHGIASRSGNGFLVALLAIEVFRRSELLRRFGQRRTGVFFRARVSRDANGVARFEEFDGSSAIDAKNGVFDFGVRGRIYAPREQLVARLDGFSASR